MDMNLTAPMNLMIKALKTTISTVHPNEVASLASSNRSNPSIHTLSSSPVINLISISVTPSMAAAGVRVRVRFKIRSDSDGVRSDIGSNLCVPLLFEQYELVMKILYSFLV